MVIAKGFLAVIIRDTWTGPATTLVIDRLRPVQTDTIKQTTYTVSPSYPHVPYHWGQPTTDQKWKKVTLLLTCYLVRPV